jgi:hypothetical protein
MHVVRADRSVCLRNKPFDAFSWSAATKKDICTRESLLVATRDLFTVHPRSEEENEHGRGDQKKAHGEIMKDVILQEPTPVQSSLAFT